MTCSVPCPTLEQVARDAFIAYAQSNLYGSGSFVDFFGQWLALDDRGLRNLAGLQGTDKTSAAQANKAFIAAERVAMRERLVDAALAGAMEWSLGLSELLPDLYPPEEVDNLDDAQRARGGRANPMIF